MLWNTQTIPAFGQENVQIITDWNLMQIDPSDVKRLQPILQRVHRELRSTLFQNLNQPLTGHQSVTGKTLSSNLSRALKNYFADQNTKDITVVAIPTLCKLGDFLVFAVEEGELGTGRLTKAYHTALPYAQLLPANQVNAADPEIAATLTARLRAEQQQAATFSSFPTKLGFNLKIDQFPFRQGSPHCATMLLSHTLAKNAAVLRVYGEQQLQLVRRTQNNVATLSRNNRMLHLTWNWKQQDSTAIKLSLAYHVSEQVFAQRLPEQGSAEFNFRLANQKIDINPFSAIVEALKIYDTELNPQSLPQIVAIDRAWVYLDRGRGWGLKMGDRLLAKDGEEWIKGHVVGYYGPGLNIRDANDKLINEGAIVYIRKGQRKTQKGLLFTFDTTAYPTPWPPVSQPQNP